MRPMIQYNSKQLEAINGDEDRKVIVAPAGSGKALKNSTKVLTPDGYKEIGNIKVGDIVFDLAGQPTKVTAVYPQGKKQVYQVTISEKYVVECCSEHLWQYQTANMRNDHSKNWRVETTGYIHEKVPLYKKRGDYYAKTVYLPDPVCIIFNAQDIIIPPYLLGAILGDGCITNSHDVGFTNAEQDILDRVNDELGQFNNHLVHKANYDYRISNIHEGVVNPFKDALRELNLLTCDSSTKFIPKEYLFNSKDNRLKLLQGLIDTDGTCTGTAYDYITVSKQLADDIEFLCESLGLTVTRTLKECSYVNSSGVRIKCKDGHRLYIKPSKDIPKLHWCNRKDKQWKKGQTAARYTITKIEPIDRYEEMTCITVDSESHCYVIEHGIITHNTSTIVGAIEKCRKDNPSYHIVAITFTRKAAGELKDRIGIAGDLEVSTIHSWAWRQLARLGNEYGFKVQLLEDDTIKEILKNLCKIRKQYYLNQFQLLSYVMGNYNIDVDDSIKKTFEVIRYDYIKFKRKNQLYDFTDLPMYLYDKLIEYDEDIKNIDALFVDEFQDIDPIQLELFNLVKATKKCYIGDPAQCIYIFRNAVEEVFEQLADFTFYNLDTNYRSYQEILNYATNMRNIGLEHIKDGRIFEPVCVMDLPQSNIICDRGFGGNIYNISRSGDCYNLANLNQNCSDILVVKGLAQNKKTQILCRANRQVKKLQALGIENVSTIHQAKGLEYDNVIMTNFPCDSIEELNIAYVGATRAKNNLCVIDYDTLLYIICQEEIKSNKKLF